MDEFTFLQNMFRRLNEMKIHQCLAVKKLKTPTDVNLVQEAYYSASLSIECSIREYLELRQQQ